jgi:UPF0271 protein
VILLNVDLGELPDEPEALYACAHLANVACGGHAGDEATMRRAVDLCRRYGTALGAHPSYPDRAGFGRRRLDIPPSDVHAAVASQCAALARVARALGSPVAFVKAHGALYHAAREDGGVAAALVAGAREALGDGATFVGPGAGELAALVGSSSLAYAREGFADRATRPDGTLVPRTEPGALITEPQQAAQRARTLAARGDVDTICVHGDTPGAVAIARAVRAALDAVDAARGA